MCVFKISDVQKLLIKQNQNVKKKIIKIGQSF